MGLTNATEVETLAAYGALPKDHDGESYNSQFNYSSIVGILLYLQHHSRPELTFAFSQCARYTYYPKLSHQKPLKRIRRYLKGTRTKGLIMKPNKDLNIDCHVDSDFAGL